MGRVQILEHLIQNKTALSHSDLSRAFEGRLDRASIYRILQDFEHHGLVHKVPDNEVSVKYAVCSHDCNQESHHDSHLHFKCDECEKTICLEDQALPSFGLPQGFQANYTEVLIHGTCQACA